MSSLVPTSRDALRTKADSLSGDTAQSERLRKVCSVVSRALATYNKDRQTVWLNVIHPQKKRFLPFPRFHPHKSLQQAWRLALLDQLTGTSVQLLFFSNSTPNKFLVFSQDESRMASTTIVRCCRHTGCWIKNSSSSFT